MLYRGFNQQTMLVNIYGGRFARGTYNHNAIGICGNVPINERTQCRQIQTAIFKHGRDDSHQTTLCHKTALQHIKNLLYK